MPRGYTQDGRVRDFQGQTRAATPTEAPPGSPEKIAQLQGRAARRESLFHARDADGEGRFQRTGKTEANSHLSISGATDTTSGHKPGSCRPTGQHGFGAHLRRQRERRGLSQGQLARKAGVSRYHLSRLERGAKRSPSLPVLIALADALGLTLDRLVGRTPPPGAA